MPPPPARSLTSRWRTSPSGCVARRSKPGGEAGPARERGPGHVAERPAALPLPGRREADGDLLDPRVAALALLPGVAGGHGQRMGGKAHAAGDDPVGRGGEPGEGAFLPGGE